MARLLTSSEGHNRAKAGGDDRHSAFDNVSICCVCHSDRQVVAIEGLGGTCNASHALRQASDDLIEERARQNIMQMGLNSGEKLKSLKMQLHSDALIKRFEVRWAFLFRKKIVLFSNLFY